MVNGRPLLVWLAIAAAMLAPPAAGAAEKVRLMVGGYEKQIYLPAKLAEALGYFAAEGLEVELLNQSSGVNAEGELLSNSVQAVIGFYDHCVDMQSKGKQLLSVVQLAQAPGEVELVSARHPEIRSMADLKGHNLGVTGLGSSTNFLTLYLALKAGVQPGQFTTVAVGAGPTFIAAMRQDQIQAGMTTEPTITRMLKSGQAAVLVDLRSVESTKAALGGTYPGASLYVTARWMEANRATVQKLANALVKTLRYIDSHSAAEITEKMPKSFYVGDKASYVRALASGKAMFTRDGVMPADGPETVLKVLAAYSRKLKGRRIDLAKTYTTEFVKNVR